MGNEKYLEQVEKGKVTTAKEDIEFSKKDLDLHNEAREDLKAQIEIENKLFEIVSKNPRPLILMAEYQKSDKYWDLSVQIMAIEFKRKISDFNIKMAQLEKVIEVKEAEYNRLKGDE